MAEDIPEAELLRKRQRLTIESEANKQATADSTASAVHSRAFASLERHITPPPRRKKPATPSMVSEQETVTVATTNTEKPRILPSPVQLTRVEDLPAGQNVDTVTLKDILGDPMIKECWQFNYLFDLDFLMSV
jgi:tyrosyl-DNA phosphodiesterase 1